MEERVVMGSFKYFNFHELKKKYGWNNINFFGGEKQCATVIFGYLLGYLPFYNTDCDIFCLPYYFESLPNVTEFPRFKNKIVWTVWRFILDNTFKYFVRHLQKRNIPVFFWTINTENDVLQCMEFGTNGIVCDNPSVLLKYIEFKEWNK